jgi:coenzyme F420-reducing hydrogenase gamma subunit
MDKPKLSMYWASSCGGCEIALVNLHEKILEVDRHFDFFFCPCLLDTKKEDVEALPDGALAITFFNGAIRTAENREMARLMRAKSQLLVAFGACAGLGSIPALSNTHSREAHLRANYLESPSLDNMAGTLPALETVMPEGELELPEFFETVHSLAQEAVVDYFIPGCPPEPHQIWNVVESVMRGASLAPQRQRAGRGSFRGVRGVRAGEERQADRGLLSNLRDPAGPAHLPSGAGAGVYGNGHAGWLRRALPAGQYALHGMLWAAGRRGRPGRQSHLRAGLGAGPGGHEGRHRETGGR